MSNPDENNCCWAYTDGACTENGYPNASAGVGVFFGSRCGENVSARFRGRQTSNSAEINAAVIAIRQALQWRCVKITIHTDSQFLVDSATKWMPRWKETGWRTLGGDLLANRKDFQRLARVMDRIEVVFIKVQAHRQNFGNSQADKLARAGARMGRESYSELDYDTDDDEDFDENPAFAQYNEAKRFFSNPENVYSSSKYGPYYSNRDIDY